MRTEPRRNCDRFRECKVVVVFIVIENNARGVRANRYLRRTVRLLRAKRASLPQDMVSNLQAIGSVRPAGDLDRVYENSPSTNKHDSNSHTLRRNRLLPAGENAEPMPRVGYVVPLRGAAGATLRRDVRRMGLFRES